MRAVIQRVSRARVTVEGRVTGQIEKGVMVLLGVGREDTSESAKYLAEKTAHLRIFPDDEGKMNRSLVDAGGTALVVSQFTLYGDTRGGRRPGFSRAAAPEDANRLYEEYVAALRGIGVRVETGIFQTHMDVELVNDGPVTILMDWRKRFDGEVGVAMSARAEANAATKIKEIQIRAARLEDAAELARLSGHLGYVVTPEEIRDRLARIWRDPAAAVFVAETAGGLAGWIQLLEQHVLELGSRVEVAALVVDENERRAGVGRRLMGHAEQWGRKRGCQYVNVRSNVKRAIAHAFYEGLGYAHIKTQKAFRKELSSRG